ncbi:MAG TPA: transporter substrate-binding domain-containing protein [Tepidimicrobium sp.]|nr:transporter substrate-binding domain-containing protein [Tepidimicrobium sp.]
MRKRAYFLCLFMIIIILISQMVNIKYDINLYEFIKYSQPLSEQERKLLEDKGTIICVSDRNAPPISFIEEQNKQYRGLVIDYMTALSIELETNIELRPLVWEDTLEALMKGNADVCDAFPSKEREKYFRFSKPIYKLKGVIVVSSSENQIQGVQDLRQRKVAIPNGDYAIEYLDKTIPSVEYVLTKDIHDALLLLQDGKVDAVVGDEPVIGYISDKLGIIDEIQILDPYLYEQDVALAVPKSEEKLLDILNKGILNLKKKDFVIKIQQRWFGISGSIEKSRISDNLILGVGMVLIASIIMLFIMYIFNDRLKEKVKERTQELHQSRMELQVTFDALGYFLVVVDSDGRITNCNKSFQNYIGERKEYIVGTHFSRWNILEYLNKKLNIFNKGKVNIVNDEEELRYKNTYYVINMFILESIENSLDQLLIVIKDVTKFKFMEKQILQENKMVAIGQLAAGVAHEIRNPLGLIRNYCYILRSSLMGKNMKAIDVIDSSVERIGRIINNLLDFSRDSEEYWTIINIGQFITNILELEDKRMDEKKIEWKLVCPDDLQLYANEESLKHIVINIIDNAIEAIKEKGWIHVFCERLEKGIILKFQDSGQGIEQENIDDIFNPFFTTKKAGEGIGLGLYIVYNEVQKLGGTIEVSSQHNMGTIFEVFLPKEKRG